MTNRQTDVPVEHHLHRNIAFKLDNVNVNVNLYSTSSQKAPLMRSNVSIAGSTRALSPVGTRRTTNRQTDVPVEHHLHRNIAFKLDNVNVNVNLYSASSQKVPLMHSNVSIAGSTRASSPVGTRRTTNRQIDVPVEHHLHRNIAFKLDNVNVNVNLYSASSQKAPLMRSNVSIAVKPRCNRPRDLYVQVQSLGPILSLPSCLPSSHIPSLFPLLSPFPSHYPPSFVGAVVQLVDYRTRNQEVADSTHTRSTASNL